MQNRYHNKGSMQGIRAAVCRRPSRPGRARRMRVRVHRPQRRRQEHDDEDAAGADSPVRRAGDAAGAADERPKPAGAAAENRQPDRVPGRVRAPDRAGEPGDRGRPERRAAQGHCPRAGHRAPDRATKYRKVREYSLGMRAAAGHCAGAAGQPAAADFGRTDQRA